MSTATMHSTVVRMIASGRVLRDSMKRADLMPVFERHEDLVRHMSAIIGGTGVQSRSAATLKSTIFVGGRPMIEVVSN